MKIKKENLYLFLLALFFVLFFPRFSFAVDDFNLSVSGGCIRSQPQASLSWETATGTPPYYIWRKREDESSYSQISSTSSLSYIDKTIVSDKGYYYQIRIGSYVSYTRFINRQYCRPYLNEPSTYCLSDGPRIKLEWDGIYGTLGNPAYKVWRATSGSPAVLTQTNSTSTIDGPNIEGTVPYTYFIQAFWSDGYSTSSSVWTKTALACPPTLNYATSCLQSTEPGGPKVDLSWNSLLGVQEYQVYQIPPGTTTPFLLVATSATSYSDKLVKSLPNNYYQSGTVSYYVKAVWVSSFQDSSQKQVTIFRCPPFLEVQDNCSSTAMFLSWTGTLAASAYNVYKDGAWLVQTPSLYASDSVSSPSSHTYYISPNISGFNSNQVSEDINCTTAPPSPAPVLTDPPIAKCQACGVIPFDSVIINSWSPSGNVDYYRLYRNGSSSLDMSSTTYTDCEVESGNLYTYSVSAFGGGPPVQEVPSPFSVSITAFNCNSPGRPDPSLTPGCSSGIPYVDLNWALTTNTYNYEVWRRTSATTTFELKITLDPDVINWRDNNVSTSTTYYYKVVAKGPPGGPSTESVPQPISTSSCFPTLPVLTFSKFCDVSNPVIKLTWTTNELNTDHYDIFRQDFQGGTIPIAQIYPPAIKEWSDYSVGNNIAYQYKLSAVGYLGQSTTTNYQPITSFYCAPPDNFTLYTPILSCSNAPYSYPQATTTWSNSANAFQYRLNRYLYNDGFISETTTIVATITSPYADRGYGNDLNLSGDDYIEFQDYPSLNNFESLTIEFWAKPNNTSSFMGVLGTGKDWNSSGTSFYFRKGNDAEDRRIFNFNITTVVGPYQNLRWGTTTSFFYQADRWYHIVCTFSSSTGAMNLYVDGQLKAGQTIATATIVNDSTLKIGTVSGVGNFKGELDNVRIYGRAISDAEVSNHYRGIYSNESNLRGVWYFDEGTGGAGQKISDGSDYGNNGTATGTPAWATNGPQPGSKYNWQILAYSRGSIPTLSNYAPVPPTIMPYCPPIKSGLVLNKDCVNGKAVVNLDWSYSFSATSFQIYRDSVLIKTFFTSDPEFSSRTWTDDKGGVGLATDTTYTYWIKSVNGAGSTESNHISKKTPFTCGPPGVPSNVQANFICATTTLNYQTPQVLLTWGTVTGAEYYEIFKNGESYKNNIYATSFLDAYPYVLASSTHYYNIISHNTASSSALSASSSVYVDYCKATKATTSVATDCRYSDNKPVNEINWEDNTFFNSAEYKIWRGDPDSSTHLIGTIPQANEIDSFAYKPLEWDSIGKLYCPNSSSLEDLSQQLTVELWMKLNEYYTGGSIDLIRKLDDPGSNHNFDFYLYGSADTNDKKVAFWGNRNGSWGMISPYSSELNLGQWYHIVLSYSSSTGGYLYINGVSQGSPAGSGNLATNTEPIFLGNLKNGLIDEVRIYNRALNATEVGEHYNKIYNNKRGLKAHWRFNEGLGNTVRDSSGLNNVCLFYNGYGANSWQKLNSSDPTYYLIDAKFASNFKKFVDNNPLYPLDSSTNYNYQIEVLGQKGDATSSPFVSMLTYGCDTLPNQPPITSTSTGCLNPSEPYNTISWTTTTNTLSSNIYRTIGSATTVFSTRLSSFQDKGSYALNFDGSKQDNVTITDSPSMDGLNAVSVETWFYIPSSATTTEYSLFHDDWLELLTYRSEVFYLAMQNWSCPVNYCYTGYLSLISPLNKGQWYHLVGTFDRYQVGNNMKLYLNGVLMSEKKYPYGPLKNGTSPFMVNPGWQYTNNYFGLIDELRIYGRALSAAEVAEHYNGVYKNETELRGAWHFEEGTSTVAYDSSGNNNNANIVDMDNGVSWLRINSTSPFYNSKIHSPSLEENTSYSYQIRGAAQSRESNPATIQITTPECGPWVSNLSVTPRCEGGVIQMFLDWDAGNIVNSTVYRKNTSTGVIKSLQVNPATNTQLTDYDIESGIVEYQYYVKIEGAENQFATSTTVTTTTINCGNAPEEPTITQTGLNPYCLLYDSRVQVEWQSGGANTSYFDILRKKEDCSGQILEKIDTVGNSYREYLDTTATNSSGSNIVTYCYQVKAVGSGENIYTLSNQLSTTTLKCGERAPFPPVEIETWEGIVTWINPNQVLIKANLTWKQDTTNAEVFWVKRDSITVGTTSGTNYSYTDLTVTDGQTYTYRIDATNKNDGPTVGYNQDVSVPIAPPGPFTLSGQWNANHSQIQLSWTESNNTVAGGEPEYQVENSATEEFLTDIVCPWQTGMLSCIDNTPDPSKPWYRVVARNLGGSTYSNSINISSSFNVIWKEVIPQ